MTDVSTMARPPRMKHNFRRVAILFAIGMFALTIAANVTFRIAQR